MANFNFNKVMLGGRLTANPEIKQTQSGVPVCTVGMAVNRRFGAKDGNQPQADFFNVTAWRNTAEFICKYFTKGSSIFVVGTLQNRSWTDPQGVKHYATDIVADEVQFVDSKADADASAGAPISDPYTRQEAPAANTYAQQSAPAPAAMQSVSGDEDLPF